MTTTVINLFGGPGCGKSTTAAGLFYALKVASFNVELVTEYAKDMVWEERANIMTDQIYMFAKQRRRLERLRGKVDYIITDSPLFLGIVYHDLYQLGHTWDNSFKKLVVDCFHSFKNLNYLLPRLVPYSPVGRNEDAEGAKAVDYHIRYLLELYGIEYIELKATSPSFHEQILKDFMND